MTTRKQMSANRRNAKKSTGPTTPEGRGISLMNSLKHGGHMSAAMTIAENPEAFHALHECLVREYVPMGPTEHMVVLDMVVVRLKQQRLASYERGQANERIFGRFLRSVGAWARTADPDEVEEAFEEFLRSGVDYDLPIDEQTKIINNQFRLDALMDRLMARLEKLQARPIEVRSRGAWSDPERPLIDSIAEHADRENEMNDSRERSRLQLDAFICMAQDRPAIQLGGPEEDDVEGGPAG
jgi:hypothetical protein